MTSQGRFLGKGCVRVSSRIGAERGKGACPCAKATAGGETRLPGNLMVLRASEMRRFAHPKGYGSRNRKGMVHTSERTRFAHPHRCHSAMERDPFSQRRGSLCRGRALCGRKGWGIRRGTAVRNGRETAQPPRRKRGAGAAERCADGCACQSLANSTALFTASRRPLGFLPPAVAKCGCPPPPPLMSRAASRTMLPA